MSVNECRVNSGYLGTIGLDGKSDAEKCAAKLTKETGQSHYVETVYRNIGDYKPLFITEYWVRMGKKPEPKAAKKTEKKNECGRTLFLSRDKAERCARERGPEFEVRSFTKNLSDGLPAFVMQTYYEVVKK